MDVGKTKTIRRIFLEVFLGFLKSIKAPWAFALVVMTTTVAMYLSIHTGARYPERLPINFSAVLVGGFVSMSTFG